MAARKPSSGPASGLTYKQRLFVSYFLGRANGNATEAARLAGYGCPEAQGKENLRKPLIRAAVDSALEGPAMQAEEVLARLSEIASGSLEDFIKVTKQGYAQIDLAKAKRFSKLHLLKKFKDTEHGQHIEIHDPLRALETLAKYHKLVGSETPGGTEDLLRGASDVGDAGDEYDREHPRGADDRPEGTEEVP